ncbi:MAG TPA: glycoside hydrolase family 38 C-terminal domain-containing protein [Gemmatimonadaceae bacterium]
MTITLPTTLAVLVVSHTHWDREWYHPAPRFRQRLVALVDELLDAPAPPGVSFLLDGQAVVLDDYLAVRPERREALATRLKDGALEAGPWYVLADELIPSAEALVRNLLVGRAVLRALGAEPPPVLYCPDSFGHPAALPTIAAGFGLPLIVLWRGYGGPHWPAGDVARWRAADGAEALLYHLPPDGYEFGASLPADERAADRWRRVRDVLAPRAALGMALLLNGADHHARQPDLDRALEALARAARPDEVRRASLRVFARELGARARGATLPEVCGELRDSSGYAWSLQGTFGTRAAQKRRNARVERMLVRDAEPWCALAARAGAPSRRALGRAAWTTLLLAHPHDTLCGTSVDAVARAMDQRLDDAQAQGEGLRDDAILDLVGHDRARAREHAHEWSPVVLVRNRAARPRGGIAELDVARFRRHVRVGPGSGHAAAWPEPSPAPIGLGARVPLQVLHDAPRHDRVESPLHYPDDDLVDVARVVAWVPPVPGYGIAALPISREPGAADGAPDAVRVGEHWIENEALRLSISAAGVVRLATRDGLMAMESVIGFEDVGDVGDLYTHSPRDPVVHPTAILGPRVVHRGPLRGELRAAWWLEVPTASTRERRSASTAALVVHAAFALDAGASFVRVRVWGENEARDHRLRVVFATGIPNAEVWADAAFGPVRRARPGAPVDDAELQPATAPLARWVTLASSARGVTVFSDGLAEYEATPTGDVAITLVRAVGELSRADLPERPGHAGWPAPVPGAQARGPFEARFALLPHGPRDASTIALVERTADDVLLPLVGDTLRSALDVPPAAAGLELDGEGLALSACKESEDGAWTVLRCVNLLDTEVRGAWRVGPRVSQRVSEARLARLDETPQEPLVVAGGTIPFAAAPRAVVTVLVR